MFNTGNDTAEKMLGVEISRTKPNISVVTLGDSVDRNIHYAVQGFVHARGAKVNSVVVPVEEGAFEGRDIYAMLAERMTLVSTPARPSFTPRCMSCISQP